MRAATSAVLLLAFSVFAVSMAGCDSGGEEEDTVRIPLGSYEEFGQRILLEGAVVSEGLAGVFFQRTFSFQENRDLTITVVSDFEPEVGVARGSYMINGQSLAISIDTTTSSYYEAGERISFPRVKVVDDGFNTTFDIDGSEVIFRGPGMILTKRQRDQNDADDDGNTDETLTSKLYFAFVQANA